MAKVTDHVRKKHAVKAMNSTLVNYVRQKVRH